MQSLSPDELALVRSTTLLEPLAPDTAERLLAGSFVHHVKKGDCVFSEADPANEIWIVLEGWFKLSRFLETGTEAIIAVLPAGESIAEPVALIKGDYPLTCTAASDGKLVALDGATIRQELRADPDLSLAILASTFRHLKRFVMGSEGLLAKSGKQRVAAFLCSLAQSKVGSASLELPFDKELIANKLGLKPQSLSRIFNQLKAEGVSVSGMQVQIESLARLHALNR